MRNTIGEKETRILSGMNEVFNVLNEFPPDKPVYVNADFFGFFMEILEDIVEDISTGKVVQEETAPEIEGLKEVHKPNLKPLKRL